jgi:hypothetical protein
MLRLATVPVLLLLAFAVPVLGSEPATQVPATVGAEEQALPPSPSAQPVDLGWLLDVPESAQAAVSTPCPDFRCRNASDCEFMFCDPGVPVCQRVNATCLVCACDYS